MTVYCNRCCRHFNNPSAYAQHTRDSSHHHGCAKCDFDAESWDDLCDHTREHGCGIVCQGCDGGLGEIWEAGSREYWQHVHEQNVCTICERHFDNSTNLQQHQISHRERNIECYRCYQTFKTYGGMIIHLERSTCNEDVDAIDLNRTAAECYKWRSFMNYKWQPLLYDGNMYSSKVYPYKCPTCNVPLRKLSSLFQHAESTACAQSADEGALRQLRNFLKSRYDL